MNLFDLGEDRFVSLLAPKAMEQSNVSDKSGDRQVEPVPLTLFGQEYHSREAALSEGLKVKYALLSWAISNEVEVDFHGFNRSQVAVEAVEEHFLFLDLRVFPSIDRSVEAFSENIAARIPRQEVSDKLLLAMELFASAEFDESSYSQFVTRVTAVEALMKQPKASQAVGTVINELQRIVDQSDLDRTEKEILCNALSRERRLSKTQTGVALANTLLPDRKYGDMSSGQLFRSLYKVRSQIVHYGRPRKMTQAEFRSLNSLGRNLVKDLIIQACDSGNSELCQIPNA